jgi:hypothetical protein
MFKSRSVRVVAAITSIIVMPLTAWWMIGDLSEKTSSPDYYIQPPYISHGTEQMIGWISLGLLLLSLFILVRSFKALPKIKKAWLGTLVKVWSAGVILALIWRVDTAGVVGANIGAGLATMVGLPIVMVLLLTAIWHHSELARSFIKECNDS